MYVEDLYMKQWFVTKYNTFVHMMLLAAYLTHLQGTRPAPAKCAILIIGHSLTESRKFQQHYLIIYIWIGVNVTSKAIVTACVIIWIR